MVDAIDSKILRELQRDGRIPWVELAERVNLSASACQRRVQALTAAGIIDGIVARIDPAALGFEVEALVAVSVERHDVERAEGFREAMRNYPEVQTCRMMSGEVDYLLSVVATDLNAFGRFIEDRILSLPGVKDASSSIVLDRIKRRSVDLADLAVSGARSSSA